VKETEVATTDVSAGISDELNGLFLRELRFFPEWEKIKACIQCGTCTASCPTSWAMDIKPRQIIGLFRAGRLDKVLRSNTVWLCASCYSCVVRCPSGVSLSDVMYALRAIGIKHGLITKGQKYPALATAFAKVVDKYGRNAESEMLARFYLGSDPFGFGKQLPLGLQMLRRGRLALLPKGIRGREDIGKMMAELEREDRG
jgi:heterodisulfide reductase subunit C